MGSFWENNGKLVWGGGGLVWCDVCPCEEKRCSCLYAENGGPFIFKTTFAGVVPKSPVNCTDCPSWNQEHKIACVKEAGCVWCGYGEGAYEPFTGCGYCPTLPCIGSVQITAFEIWDGSVEVRVIAFEDTNYTTAEFLKTIPGPVPVNLDNLGDIPLVRVYNRRCNWFDATCNLGS